MKKKNLRKRIFKGFLAFNIQFFEKLTIHTPLAGICPGEALKGV
jgi:hypothetical protein